MLLFQGLLCRTPPGTCHNAAGRYADGGQTETASNRVQSANPNLQPPLCPRLLRCILLAATPAHTPTHTASTITASAGCRRPGCRPSLLPPLCCTVVVLVLALLCRLLPCCLCLCCYCRCWLSFSFGLLFAASTLLGFTCCSCCSLELSTLPLAQLLSLLGLLLA